MWIIEFGRRMLAEKKHEKEWELIKNETPLEKTRRNHKNRSEAQQRRRRRESLQRQRGEQ